MSKKKTALLSGLILSFFVIVSSCSKNKFTPTCDGSNPTYETEVKDIINGSCMGSGCHGSGSSNGDFTSYAKLQPYLTNGSFERSVLINMTMPEGSSMPESQLNKLQCWVENNYPKN